MCIAMARKKKAAESEPVKLFYLFYTQERWDNWIRRLEESSFEEEPGTSDMPEGLRTIQNFTDDVNIEVLKIIRLQQNDRFSAEEAMEKIRDVEEIVMGEPGESEVADIVGSLQVRFLVLFDACKKYLDGKFSGEIKELVKKGRSVAEKDPDASLEVAGNIGALVIDGGSCCGKYLRGDIDDPTLFDDWLIEIDEMANALKSLQKFDEEPGEAS